MVKNRCNTSANSFEAISDDVTQGGVLLPLLMVKGVFLTQVFDGYDGRHRLSHARSRCSLKTQRRKEIHVHDGIPFAIRVIPSLMRYDPKFTNSPRRLPDSLR